jgi:hypothetical protein
VAGLAERPAAARDVLGCNQPGHFSSSFRGFFAAIQGAFSGLGQPKRRFCHYPGRATVDNVVGGVLSGHTHLLSNVRIRVNPLNEAQQDKAT